MEVIRRRGKPEWRTRAASQQSGGPEARVTEEGKKLESCLRRDRRRWANSEAQKERSRSLDGGTIGVKAGREGGVNRDCLGKEAMNDPTEIAHLCYADGENDEALAPES
ncbi:hypothetical protein E3N88_29369 [Mikania micrantha]|uniref:Uncharacterized protein n=1 Tax=Mikania micrantha TaxID=192012 RepID=A0A5N6MJ99_9ASTR|nr:hypothetical protein E3N88_29369 [Mikania micrantha]